MANESQMTGQTSWGKRIATVGATMLAASVALAFTGVAGAMLHNTLQLGGIGLLVIGLVIWKLLKR